MGKLGHLNFERKSTGGPLLVKSDMCALRAHIGIHGAHAENCCCCICENGINGKVVIKGSLMLVTIF